MDLKELQKNWDELGRDDPLWAIISCPDKKGNKWQIQEILQKGLEEIDEIMKYIDILGIKIQRRKALDFGCGVGRLSQALTNYFEDVHGVDIAPSMIELANKYNRFINKCKYYLNASDNLLLFADNTFDFIYTNITLQHIEPEYSKKYLKEFLRILTSQGILIFQLPSQPVSQRLIPKVWIDNTFPRIEMHYIAKEEVVKLIQENGGKIADIRQEYWAGPAWLSYRYSVVKE